AEAEKIPKELTKNIEFDNLNQLRDELKVLVNLLSERI
ncbi:MarR family transcriptional regulator, partial [Escherichia coli]|nr:MarR family transcriptional regulator [Escherichia coli]